ncbi:Crp/Fnr family transcriptional regulator [Bradyrhizobium liaoningense]|uniref:Crp/Fnr family transcriptional regulator n=1 Tax=Bradyrhizobium liaoningense TaxID=43992 RepID=UPI001BA5D87E|nr:Crp/Fnr family transcriptional regulator [Bradyrhizobium liaoningense]MBR0718464.1 Crp/Fnr family transcriptional regulator [Bradyrhizobium liaoningense]
MTERWASVQNRLLASLPSSDRALLTPHLQRISFKADTVLVRSDDELRDVYFLHSGAVAFMLDMPDGQTVATTLVGPEGAVGSLSALGPSVSPVTVLARVAGTASHITAANFQSAYMQSPAIRQIVQVHTRALLLQLQHVAACNALHSVERRMARWLLQLHDIISDRRLPLTQEALAQLLGVRRTTVTQAVARLREAGAIKSDRRGLIEVHPARLDGLACECYAMVQTRIARMYDQELSESGLATGPAQVTRATHPRQLGRRGAK